LKSVLIVVRPRPEVRETPHTPPPPPHPLVKAVPPAQEKSQQQWKEEEQKNRNWQQQREKTSASEGAHQPEPSHTEPARKDERQH
jgi:hypothetical protein